MTTKKTDSVRVRISQEDKETLENLAISLDEDLSSLIRKTMTKLAEAQRIHGKYLVWPLEFNHFSHESETQQDTIEKANSNTARKAG